MPRGYRNWNYRQVKKVLEDNGFSIVGQKGSHVIFFRILGGIPYSVYVPYHTDRAIKIKTFKNIVKESGISKGMWGI